MKQSNFFAVKSNSAKKLRNFIRLVKRMGINHNDDWGSHDVLSDYPRTNSQYGLGFSNKWGVPNALPNLTCAMTPINDFIDIDTTQGYIDAVKRVVRELEELSKPIFSDINGDELKVGDSVVMIDNDDLVSVGEDDVVFRIGELLVVEQLLDLDPNYIIFRSGKSGLSNGFYGHRVAKFL